MPELKATPPAPDIDGQLQKPALASQFDEELLSFHGILPDDCSCAELAATSFLSRRRR